MGKTQKLVTSRHQTEFETTGTIEAEILKRAELWKDGLIVNSSFCPRDHFQIHDCGGLKKFFSFFVSSWSKNSFFSLLLILTGSLTRCWPLECCRCEVVSLHRLGHWRRVASIFFFGTYALEESRSYVRSSYTLRLPCSGSPSWPEIPMISPHLIQPSSL